MSCVSRRSVCHKRPRRVCPLLLHSLCARGYARGSGAGRHQPSGAMAAAPTGGSPRPKIGSARRRGAALPFTGRCNGLSFVVSSRIARAGSPSQIVWAGFHQAALSLLVEAVVLSCTRGFRPRRASPARSASARPSPPLGTSELRRGRCTHSHVGRLPGPGFARQGECLHAPPRCLVHQAALRQ